ncbi:ABC transporter ATP-binding protein, partial [Vibrio parahaemolyticus]|nr:ABC transporter ATP-binding protein [Vibrio parahaemolyticus]
MPAHRSDPTSSVIELNDVVFCWPGASSPTLDIAHLQ